MSLVWRQEGVEESSRVQYVAMGLALSTRPERKGLSK